MAAAGFVAGMGHRAGVCPCKASGAGGSCLGAILGGEQRALPCTVFTKSSGQGTAWGGGEAARSNRILSFPAKPLPRFISNWEKGPSVAQPVEDAGSLWEKGV